MFNNSQEYYDLNDITNIFSNILGEKVTPAMLHDYIRMNKLIPYVLYSGVVFGASYRAEYYNKPIKVELINMRVYCTALFKASIENIELLPLSVAARLGDSSPLYNLEEDLSDDKMPMTILEGLQPIGYRLFYTDGEINKHHNEQVSYELKFKSRDLIQFANEIQEKLQFNDLIEKLKIEKSIREQLEISVRSLELSLNQNNTRSTNQTSTLAENNSEELHIRSANNAAKIISALASELLELDITKPYSEESNGAIRKAIERQGNSVSAGVIAYWLKTAHEQSL